MTDRECMSMGIPDEQLKQCPYDRACKCLQDEPCDGCETKAEHDQGMRTELRRKCKENFREDGWGFEEEDGQ